MVSVRLSESQGSAAISSNRCLAHVSPSPTFNVAALQLILSSLPSRPEGRGKAGRLS